MVGVALRGQEESLVIGHLSFDIFHLEEWSLAFGLWSSEIRELQNLL
jgi:hypothetical protein